MLDTSETVDGVLVRLDCGVEEVVDRDNEDGVGPEDGDETILGSDIDSGEGELGRVEDDRDEGVSINAGIGATDEIAELGLRKDVLKDVSRPSLRA